MKKKKNEDGDKSYDSDEIYDLIYEFRDNHLVPITASGVNLTSGNAEFTPKKFNYLNIGISLNLNSITNFINK